MRDQLLKLLHCSNNTASIISIIIIKSSYLSKRCNTKLSSHVVCVQRYENRQKLFDSYCSNEFVTHDVESTAQLSVNEGERNTV